VQHSPQASNRRLGARTRCMYRPVHKFDTLEPEHLKLLEFTQLKETCDWWRSWALQREKHQGKWTV
jgi:hypothetical protein